MLQRQIYPYFSPAAGAACARGEGLGVRESETKMSSTLCQSKYLTTKTLNSGSENCGRRPNLALLQATCRGAVGASNYRTKEGLLQKDIGAHPQGFREEGTL